MAASGGVGNLLANAGATSQAVAWVGGRGFFSICAATAPAPGGPGNWNGATATLQTRGPDGQTWVTLGAGTTFVANNVGIFECPPQEIRVLISGAVPTGLYAAVARIIS